MLAPQQLSQQTQQWQSQQGQQQLQQRQQQQQLLFQQQQRLRQQQVQQQQQLAVGSGYQHSWQGQVPAHSVPQQSPGAMNGQMLAGPGGSSGLSSAAMQGLRGSAIQSMGRGGGSFGGAGGMISVSSSGPAVGSAPQYFSGMQGSGAASAGCADAFSFCLGSSLGVLDNCTSKCHCTTSVCRLATPLQLHDVTTCLQPPRRMQCLPVVGNTTNLAKPDLCVPSLTWEVHNAFGSSWHDTLIIRRTDAQTSLVYGRPLRGLQRVQIRLSA